MVSGLNKCDPDHTTTHSEDVELMLAFQKGDEEAFVKLYRRYRDKIANYTRRLLGGEIATSEEATQDVFVKLYQARNRYTPTSKFSTYLFRIATNHCLNIRARHERKLLDHYQDVEAQQGAESLERNVAQSRLRSMVRDAVSALPKKQAAALILCHYEGLRYDEAAHALNVTPKAIKSLLFRAKSSLVEKLRPVFFNGEVL